MIQSDAGLPHTRHPAGLIAANAIRVDGVMMGIMTLPVERKLFSPEEYVAFEAAAESKHEFHAGLDLSAKSA